MAGKILPHSFYESDDVKELSQALLGKVLVTEIDGCLTSGVIVETEAYQGPEDKASHAYNNRCTERTKTMFLSGGVAYVYLCYGIHNLFNVVTNKKGIPHAILVRALQPLEGVEHMQKRTNNVKSHLICAGPGKLTKALGIGRQLDGLSLSKSPIWIEDRGKLIQSMKIRSGPRIGIDYAEEFKSKPWRYWIDKHPAVSK